MSKNNNMLILLNELIIDIINDKKYFNKVEYENIKKLILIVILMMKMIV